MVRYNSAEEAVHHLGMRQAGTEEVGETVVQHTGLPWTAAERRVVHQEGTVEPARIPLYQLVGAEEGTGCCSACLDHGQKHLICSTAVPGQLGLRHTVWVAVAVGPADSQDSRGRDRRSLCAPLGMMCGDGCAIAGGSQSETAGGFQSEAAGGSQSETTGGCRRMTWMNDDFGRLGLAGCLTRTMWRIVGGAMVNRDDRYDAASVQGAGCPYRPRVVLLPELS